MLRREALASGMKTLYQEGTRKAEQGLTTPQEIARVTEDL
jgi:type II secretory ATPase GspE/PulE/Tfp pilus assembly ATPase PilB-like protein